MYNTLKLDKGKKRKQLGLFKRCWSCLASRIGEANTLWIPHSGRIHFLQQEQLIHSYETIKQYQNNFRICLSSHGLFFLIFVQVCVHDIIVAIALIAVLYQLCKSLVVQEVGRAVRDECRLGEHLSVCSLLSGVHLAAKDIRSVLQHLVKSHPCSVREASSPTHNAIKHCRGHCYFHVYHSLHITLWVILWGRGVKWISSVIVNHT